MRSSTRFTPVAGAVCAAVLTLSGPVARAVPAEGGHAATLSALRAFQSQAGPGAAVHAGALGGSWTLSAGTGTAGADLPIGPDEYFRVGSQTKTFVAVVVLQLAEEGRVALNAPVADHLPGVVAGNGYDGARITVRQLLQHTSGIAPYNPYPGVSTPRPEPDGAYSLTALVRQGLSVPPVAEPGAGFTYSNTNYYVLGLLIEKLTGQPVHRAVTERAIAPLGLTRTLFPAPGERALPAPAVNGYHIARLGPFSVWTPVTDYDSSLYSSVGGMVSTLADLTAFHRALAGGALLAPESLAEMRTTLEVNPTVAYGLGLHRRALPCGGTAWGHSGVVPGYQSYTLVTDDGRHASVVTNAAIQFGALPTAALYKVMDTALCEDAPQDS
ncbi:serine hydrolase domain-containing protein [Kitasatospora sp. NPDC002551]|uniref:serine hydrolase domain-containing protein n=1 Tax=Kitasatospora sp. NPDC002551 TaxID=3154539 RepID=UPI0033283C8B